VPQKIPDGYLDLFNKKAFAYLATVMSNGGPQVTPVWVDYDGENILINSAKGRIKDNNMERRPQVALTVQDPDDPYRNLSIQGTVVQIIEEGARDHIDKLAGRYTGNPKYQGPSEQIRRIYKIRTDKVLARGS
jgi:PPOX class probable F420-dependent enzyme